MSRENAAQELSPGRPRASRAPGRDRAQTKPLDLTGRERQLRSAMQAMGRVAARFARATRRTLPFLLRRKSRLVADAVNIASPFGQPAPSPGPSFEVTLEAEDSPAWGAIVLDAESLQILLEGALGASEASGVALGIDLTLAQRALVSRIARALAEDFAEAVRAESGLSLGVATCQSLAAGEAAESLQADGLRVECRFLGIAGNAHLTIAVSAEALEAAAREQEETAPQNGDPRMAAALTQVPVEVVAELGRMSLGLRRVLSLEVGQVLRLPTAVDDPVLVRVGGVGKFEAAPVVSRGQLSVEIKGRHGP